MSLRDRSGPGLCGRPCIRWAGSKRKLVPKLLELGPSKFGRYIEPFVGSGCLYFALAPEAAILSDINPALMEAYRIIRNRPTLLVRRLLEMPNTARFYYELRAADPKRLGLVERAARFLYLNRHCFNGVYRTNRQGNFNVPRGQKTGSLPSLDEFVACSRLLQSAELQTGDFESCIQRVKRGDFVYLDPPYAKQSRVGYGEYGYGAFGVNDFPRLLGTLRLIEERQAFFVLSYSFAPEIRRHFLQWNYDVISVHRHVAGFRQHRRDVKEVLVSNIRS